MENNILWHSESSITVSEEGEYMISTYKQKKNNYQLIKLFFENDDFLIYHHKHSDPVLAVMHHEEFNRVVSADTSNFMIVHELNTGEVLKKVNFPVNKSLVWNIFNNIIFVGVYKELKFFDLRNLEVLFEHTEFNIDFSNAISLKMINETITSEDTNRTFELAMCETDIPKFKHVRLRRLDEVPGKSHFEKN
jgi:hypothetical protein